MEAEGCKTRADAVNASFDDDLDLSENFSDAHNIDLSPQSHDENDSVNFKGLADEIVGKQKVLEKLLSSLPFKLKTRSLLKSPELKILQNRILKENQLMFLIQLRLW